MPPVSGVIATLGDGTSVPNVEALKAHPVETATVDVAGLLVPGDEGGGVFEWIAASMKQVDAILVQSHDDYPLTGPGRWERALPDGRAFIEWWMAAGWTASQSVSLAMAAGFSLTLKANKTYHIVSSFLFDFPGQTVIGQDASTLLILEGAFNLFHFTVRAEGASVKSLRFEGTAHTAGYVFAIDGADRVYCEDIEGYCAWSGIYVTGANMTTFREVFIFGLLGDFMALLYGTRTSRSDVVVMDNCTISAFPFIEPLERPNGIYWIGNINTLDLNMVRMVNPLRGLTSTKGDGSVEDGTATIFLVAVNVQVDFPTFQGLDLIDGWGMDLTDCYFSNSLYSENVYIGNGVYMGSMKGGKVLGAAHEGMIIDAIDFQVIGPAIQGNSWGPGNFGKYPGVRVLSNARNISFNGVRSGRYGTIGATQSWGLVIENGALETTWTGGSLSGNLLGEWIDHTASNLSNIVAAGAHTLTNGMMISRVKGYGVVLGTPVVDGNGCITSVPIVYGGQHLDPAFPPAIYVADYSASPGAGFTAHLTIVSGTATAVVVDTTGSGYDSDAVVYAVYVAAYPYLVPFVGTNDSLDLELRGLGAGGVNVENEYGSVIEHYNLPDSTQRIRTWGVPAGATPLLTVEGPADAIALEIRAKGPSQIYLSNDVGVGLEINSVTDAVNRVAIWGQVSGGPVLITAVGDDTDIPIDIQALGDSRVLLSSGNGIGFEALALTGATCRFTSWGGAGYSLLRTDGTPDDVPGLIQAKGAAGIQVWNDQGVLFDMQGVNGAMGDYWQSLAWTGATILQAVGASQNIDAKVNAKGTGVFDVGSTTAASAGAASGTFLNIKVNGVPYKVQLFAVS